MFLSRVNVFAHVLELTYFNIFRRAVQEVNNTPNSVYVKRVLDDFKDEAVLYYCAYEIDGQRLYSSR